MIRTSIAVLMAGAVLSVQAVASPDLPRPVGLEPDIAFWTRIYTEVDTRSGLIHDSRNLGVVYEVVEFPKGTSRRSRNNKVKRIKDKYAAILRALAKGGRDGLNADHLRILSLWSGASNSELRQAAGHLRFQLGQADKFRAGLVRSGTWLPYIERTLASRSPSRSTKGSTSASTPRSATISLVGVSVLYCSMDRRGITVIPACSSSEISPMWMP